MPLVINIETNDPALGQNDARRVEVAQRLSIGRGPDNDLVLPDPQRHLSKTHCIIEVGGQGCTVTDTSTNGVFLDDSQERLPRNVPVPLVEGHVLRFGGYQISIVAIAPTAMPEAPRPSRVTPAAAPHDGLFGDPLEGSPLPGEAGPAAFPGPGGGFSDFAPPAAAGHHTPILPDDGDDLFGSPQPSPPSWQGASHADHVPSSQVFFSPPKLTSSVIPEDWDDAGLGAPAAPKAPPRQVLPPEPFPAAERFPSAEPFPPAEPPPARPPRAMPGLAAPRGGAGDSAAVAAFLAGVGLGDATLSEADKLRLMRQVGETYAAMTRGLIEILAARATTKQEFRIERTTIGALRNNPLKFSGSAEEALRVMLLGRTPGFLPAKEAVEEALGDIKSHQLAVLAGMQVALATVIARFDPDRLENRLDQKSLIDGILPAARKARYWELFKALYKEIATELEEDFQKSFGTEFARAYRNQIERL